MKTPVSLLPDSPTLTLRLTSALERDERHPVKILRRTLPPFMSTFPNEIVTCRLPDGHKRRIFIKYQAGRSHECYGHRGDVPYEADVYRSVRLSDIVWKRLTRQPRAMSQAASWIGKFHATHKERIDDLSLSFLRKYDAEYYRGWAQRTFDFSRPLHGRLPWLTKLSWFETEACSLSTGNRPQSPRGRLTWRR